ncbi:hypothetical protein BHE74_00021853 [Ensete ventricosum]|nr:hypothetical protein GW17_00013243 [Ensete ventricosum]RWW70475.1 hypothetical protein BHE74_00021853 [Ensete ventricosum]
MPMSLSCYWVSGMERLSGLVAERDGGSWVDGYGLELTGCCFFGCCWGCDLGLLIGGYGSFRCFWVMKIGYDGCVLRLKGCPKDVLGGGSKIVGFRWVKEKKKDKGAAADFSSKKFQQ